MDRLLRGGVLRRAVAVMLTAFLAFAATSAVPGAAAQTTDPLSAELRTWIDDHGPLRVGAYRGGAPVVLIEDDEAVGGWGVEVWEAIALKLGIDVEFVIQENVAATVASLEADDIDLTVAMGQRPDLESFGSTRPHSWTPIVLVVNDSLTDVLSVGDMAGRTVTTIPGSPIEGLLADRMPEATYVVSPTLPEGIDAVASGEVDGFVGPLAIIGYRLQITGQTLRPVGDPLDIIEVSAFGVEGGEALEIARIGRNLMTPNELSIIHVRWTGFDLGDPALSEVGVPAWLLPVVGTLVGLAVLLGLFALALRRRVAAATGDLQVANETLEARVEERSAALATSNRQLREFADDMAHDVRGPLGAIRGLSHVAQGLDSAEQKRVLGLVEASSDRLLQLIDGLLDRSTAIQDNSGRETGAEFTDFLADLVVGEAEVQGVDVAFDVMDGPLDLDLGTLRKVAVNLVGNAIKHGADADQPRIVVQLHRERDHWRLAVCDNGRGIPVEQRERVLELGVRLHEDAPGHGLGLAAVAQSVQRAGGTLSIDRSELGGARVTALLPVVVVDAHADAGLGGALDATAMDLNAV